MRNLFKIAIIKSLLLLAGFYAYGQSYFESSMDIDSMPGRFAEVLEIDNHYYSFGANSNTQKNRRELSITRYDSVGNEEWTKVFGDTFELFYVEEVYLYDSSLVIFGEHLDSSFAPSQIYMAKIDLNGNWIWMKTYGNAQKDESILSSFQTNDSSFVLVGSGTEAMSDFSDIHIIKINKNGMMVWEKWHGADSISDLGGGGVLLNDGEILISGTTKQYNNEFHQYLLKIDSLGNLIWDSIYHQNSDNRIAICSKLNEHNISIIANGYNISSTLENISLYAIDEKGNVVWNKNHVIGVKSKLWGVLINNDGSILGYGASLDSNLEEQAFLALFTQRGDTIWTRNYKFNSSSVNYLNDIIRPQIDSSYLFVGTTTNVGSNSDGWIKKLDCMGCDSVQCYFPDSCFVYDCRNDYPPVADFTLAQDTFFYKQGDSISIKFENSGYDAAAFTWFFGPPAGQAGTGDSLNLVNPKYTFYQPGDYEITLVARNMECTDTAKATLHILDATGVENPISSSNGLTIFPNPFSQNVRISAQTNGALSIYNELGQMVFQQTIIQNKPIIVEGNELGNNGIYFVILSTSKGRMLREKIVLHR